jgi:hypothetical protein
MVTKHHFLDANGVGFVACVLGKVRGLKLSEVYIDQAYFALSAAVASGDIVQRPDGRWRCGKHHTRKTLAPLLAVLVEMAPMPTHGGRRIPLTTSRW